MNDKVDKTEVETGENKAPLVKINRENYVATRSATGAKSLSNGDPVAMTLEGLGLEALYGICDKLIKENEFATKYAHLNVGMQRMNLGNRIRGFISKRGVENEKIAAKATEDGAEPKLKADGHAALEKAAAPYRKEADKAAEAKAKATAKAKTADKAAAKAKTAAKSDAKEEKVA